MRSAGHILLFTLSTLSFSCKFPELPPLDDDAGVDAAALDAAVGPAVVSTSQGPHDFGAIVIGQLSPVLQVTIRNSGGENTGPLSVAVTGANFGEFSIVPTGDSSDCATARLAGGATCIAQVRYAPTANATASARFEVSGIPGGTATVMLTGDALTPANLTSTQGGYDFGDLVTGQPSTLLAVVVRNDGEQSSGAVSVTLTGAHPGDFTIVPTGTSTDCAGATLDLLETCIAQVRFQPSSATPRTANLVVTGAPGGAVTVPLMGDGLNPGNLVVEMPAGGAALDFGTREIGTGATSATQTIRIRNTGGAPTGLLDVALNGGGAGSYSIPIESCDNVMLGANLTCDVQVRFNPAAVGNQPATVSIRDTVAMTAASVSTTGVGSARVAVTKTGSGTVTSSPAGINCAPGCSSQTQSFTQTPISVTATPESGWVFTSWSGGCIGSNPSPVCSLVIDQGLENVGAVFTQVFVLNVATAGSGTVTSATAGILCGNGNTDCMETYPVSSMVQLDAEPDAGWDVFSWTGTGVVCTAGARSCTVSMSQARTVMVEFRRTYTLTVAVSGSGQGTVTGSFTGGSINCATGSVGTCMATVFDATSITLTQAIGSTTAGSQIIFAGWGTDCAGAGTMTTCTLSINGAKNVLAGFTLQHRLTLTVNAASTGMGTITASPGNFTCAAGTCTQYFDATTNLTITATGASPLDGFSSFTGDCNVTPCFIVGLSAPKTTTATFVRYQCVPTSESCTAGLYTQCDSSGNFVSHVVPNGGTNGTPTTITMNAFACPMLACHSSQPRCADIDASNGLNAALDAAQTSSTGIDLMLPRNTGLPNGTIVMTGNYDGATGTTTIVDTDGTSILVPAAVVPQAGLPSILVLKVRTFTLRAGNVLHPRQALVGGNSIAIASHFDVYIAGTIDLSGHAPGYAGLDADSHLPAGSRSGPCSGEQMNFSIGGGGNAQQGGASSGGGAGGASQTGLQPLVGGCDGMLGNGQANGGGAIQIVSRTRVALPSTALVDLSGGRGFYLTGVFSGGGGSGGFAVIEAPAISLTAGGTIAGRGGSGAAMNGTASGGSHGFEGPATGTTGAASVTCSGCGTSGAGGTEGVGPGAGVGVRAAGGGSGGRCFTRNQSGSLGSMMPPAGFMKIVHAHSTLLPRSPP